MNNRKITLYLLLLVITYLSFSGCRKDENPVAPSLEKKDTLSVSVSDQTNTAITLRVCLKGSEGKWRFVLTRLLNGKTEMTDSIYVYGKDTLIYDNNSGEGLLPDTAYTYLVKIPDNGDTSSVTARTLGYTTNNYTWTEYSFGDASFPRSYFESLGGVSKNNVYAGGSVRLNINGELVGRGIFHWNGVNWRLVEERYDMITAIYGFSDNDIWFSGNWKLHYDGSTFVSKGIRVASDGQVTILDSILARGQAGSMWGTSSNNLYIGGTGQNLIHWNGKKAEYVNIPVSADVTDIYGRASDDIYVAVGRSTPPIIGELFHYDGKTWTLIASGRFPVSSVNEMVGPFVSVWAYSKDEIFLGAGRLYRKVKDKWELKSLPFSILSVRGTKPNNVFVSGNMGRIAHYNGKDWEIIQLNSEVVLSDIYLVDDEVFVCGWGKTRAYIYHGKKSQ